MINIKNISNPLKTYRLFKIKQGTNHPRTIAGLFRLAMYKWLDLPLWGRAVWIALTVVLICLLVATPWVHAASQGPNSASATTDCVDDGTSSGAGTVTWTSPGNAFSFNSTYATASVDGTATHYVKCTNFGFTIPTGSTILGVVVGVNRKSSGTGNGGCQDFAMRLVKGGTVGTTDRSTTTVYTLSDTYEDHGTSTDMWGTTLSAADVNASNFGAAFAAQKASAAGAAQTVSVDHMRMTVYYTPPTISYAQSSYRLYNNQDTSATATFIKTLSGASINGSKSIVQTTDGGYVAINSTSSFGAGGSDVLIAKYTSTGNLSWSKTWGGANDDYPNNGIQTSDGGYVVTGRTLNFSDTTNGDMFIVKFTSTGAVSWSKTWGGATGIDEGYSIVQQPADDSYAVVGITSTFGAGSYDIFIAKFTSTGTLSWSKTWGGTGNDYGNSVVATYDGGYIIAGASNSSGFGAGSYDGVLNKYSSIGTLSWSKTWGGTGNDQSNSVIQTSDGGYAVTGNTTSFADTTNGDMFIAKFTSTGTLSWSKTWGGTGIETSYSIISTSVGGLVVAGQTDSFGAGNTDIFINNYTATGTLSWSKTWGDTAADTAKSLIQTADNGFAVAGTSNSQALLSKYNSSGNISGCSSSNCKTDGTDFTSTQQTDGTDYTSSTNTPSGTVKTDGTDYTSTVTTPSGTVKTDGTDYTSTNTYIVSLAPASIDVGTSLAAQSTAATIAGDGTPFRLRVDVAISSAQLNAGAGSFKLQYAPLSTSCDATPSGSYTNVTDSTTVRYYDNPNAVNDMPLTTNANDPTPAGSATVRQTYQEKGSTAFTNPTAIPAGQDGLWDFALTTYHTMPSQHYCLRMVLGSGTGLNSYTSGAIGEIITPSAPTYSQNGYSWLENKDAETSMFLEAWGGSSLDYGYGIVQTSDGGFAVTGYTYSFTSAMGDIVVAKYDKYGSKSWSRTWGGTATDVGHSITLASDGNLVVTGWTASFGSGTNDAVLLKYNVSTGALIWAKTWGGAGNDFGYSVAPSYSNGTADGFVVTGMTASYGDTANGDAFLAKFNTSGSLLWSRTWGGSSGQEYAHSVIQISDGGYAISGQTASFGAGSDDAFVAKYANDGTFSWSKTWGGSGSDISYAVIQTSDGGYAISGQTASFGAGSDDAFVAKITSTGSLSWSKTWGGLSADHSFSLIQTSDGNYVMAGETSSFGGGGTDLFMAKLSGSGGRLWSETSGDASDDKAYSIVQTTAGLAVAGMTNSVGAGGGGDIILGQFDINGENIYCGLNCNFSTSYTVYSDGIQFSSTVQTDGTDYTSSRTSPSASVLTDGTDFTSTQKTDGTDYTSTATAASGQNYVAVVGAPTTGLNQVSDLVTLGQTFRLRMLLGVSATGLAALGQNFKLQYASKNGTCSASSYSDVTTSTPIRWGSNSNIAGNFDEVAGAYGDPADGGKSVIPQVYVDSGNASFTNNRSIIYAGQDGMWDFALQMPSGSWIGTDICLRAVKSDGTALSTYNYYPEIQYGPNTEQRLYLGGWFDQNGVKQPHFLGR